jgi:hypothetical protein
MNTEQNDAMRSTWIGLLERDLTEIFIECEDYPVVTRGKLKDVVVRDSWRMGTNPNDVMSSLLESINSGFREVLVEEESQSD